ncbi:unnamed protein product [Rotaria sp. Silwood2]|nr:unnamed protein product [Rotaria sp. Silwood2]CAF4169915.1 unnamed protein product [Rotaria sp. Silwood2]
MRSALASGCRIWHVYGPAETTIISTYHEVNFMYQKSTIPLGRPISNYQCLICDMFDELVFIGQQGELLVGGIGVFMGYLGRDDLTTKALVTIGGTMYYRTGDLARMDNSGLIYYIGREDHQVKLRGQRIEIGEIERCLLDAQATACIVTKYGNDHLVAYVQGSNIDEEVLRIHCCSRLPLFMVPSKFIVLSQLPLNANGKVDRSRLPTPDFSSLDTTIDNHHVPNTEMEERVHDFWCEVLEIIGKRLSTTASFFTVGGHSLLLIKLYHRYQSFFSFDGRKLTISMFLQQPTIAEHARLLEGIRHTDMKLKTWTSLHIKEGNAVVSSNFKSNV